MHRSCINAKSQPICPTGRGEPIGGRKTRRPVVCDRSRRQDATLGKNKLCARNRRAARFREIRGTGQRQEGPRANRFASATPPFAHIRWSVLRRLRAGTLQRMSRPRVKCRDYNSPWLWAWDGWDGAAGVTAWYKATYEVKNILLLTVYPDEFPSGNVLLKSN